MYSLKLTCCAIHHTDPLISSNDHLAVSGPCQSKITTGRPELVKVPFQCVSETNPELFAFIFCCWEHPPTCCCLNGLYNRRTHRCQLCCIGHCRNEHAQENVSHINKTAEKETKEQVCAPNQEKGQKILTVITVVVLGRREICTASSLS